MAELSVGFGDAFAMGRTGWGIEHFNEAMAAGGHRSAMFLPRSRLDWALVAHRSAMCPTSFAG